MNLAGQRRAAGGAGLFGRCLLGAMALAVLAPTAMAASTDPRVDAFRATCVPDRQNYEAMKQRALAGGWALAHAGMSDELDAVVEIASTVELDPGMTASAESYAKGIATGDAYLVVTNLTSPDGDLAGCYLYDFDAMQPISEEIVADWLGAAPSDSVDEPSVIVGYTWDNPAALPGTTDVYLGFIPDSGPASAYTGFSGAVLRITSVEPKEE
jgi:hypothetical protein